VVGERVGELGRDRPDVSANAPEVVEQARPLRRELRQERRQRQDVDTTILRRGCRSGLRRFAVCDAGNQSIEDLKGGTMKRLVALIAAGTAAAAWVAAFFFDKDNGRRRRKTAFDRTAGFFRRRAREAGRAGRGIAAETYGVAMKATHLREEPKPQPDDVTLARKVETEIFRPADVPKGKIDVNAENGVVYLRGEADTPQMIEELVERTQKVQGVKEVQNLLHLPKTPAPMKE
jgi:hypothetical protein